MTTTSQSVYSPEDDPYNNQADETLEFIRTVPWLENMLHHRCNILELGCRTGSDGRRILLQYPEPHVVGTDICRNSLGKLRQLVDSEGISGRYSTVPGDINNRGLFRENSFDIVLAPMILHHFMDFRGSLVPDNIRHWLSPGGALVVIDPNGANPVQQGSNILVRSVLLQILRGVRRVKCPDETMYTPSYYASVFGDRGFECEYRRTNHRFVRTRFRGSGLLYVDLLVTLRNLLFNLAAPFLPGDLSGATQTLLFKNVK